MGHHRRIARIDAAVLDAGAEGVVEFGPGSVAAEDGLQPLGGGGLGGGVGGNADLLLPSDTPVGALMPQILDILDDRPRESLGAKVLVRSDGDTVPAVQTFAEAGVLDGERLALVSQTEAPPAPIIYDLNDTVSDATDAVRGRWSDTYRFLISGTLAALGAWLAVVGLLEDNGVGGSFETEASKMLREAAELMWTARMELGIAQPDTAMPYMKKILAILNEYAPKYYDSAETA